MSEKRVKQIIHMSFFEFTEGALGERVNKYFETKFNGTVGATACFEGTVRGDIVGGKCVKGIDFSVHEEIAMNQIKILQKSIMKKYNILASHIQHSKGFVTTGQKCFRVEVFAAHRKEAFLALPELVNRFKAEIPVFGKEILDDDSYVWKKNRN
jgi:molybdopterin synthase catalytic subunit